MSPGRPLERYTPRAIVQNTLLVIRISYRVMSSRPKKFMNLFRHRDLKRKKNNTYLSPSYGPNIFKRSIYQFFFFFDDNQSRWFAALDERMVVGLQLQMSTG